jgi:hypothetical protein
VPCLIPDFYAAAEAAFVVVAVETAVISRIRTRYLDTPFPAGSLPVSASVARSSSLLASLP